MEHMGIISVVPALSVIVLAIILRRTFEPLLFGSILGFILLDGLAFFPAWLDAVYVVMMDDVTVWVILVCGLYGSLIGLLEKSRGVLGFSTLATSITKTRSASLIGTWILGILIFIDDYLNNLTVGVAMRKVTDSFKLPRELLAYVINSTGAVVCVIVPVSTWAAFMAGQLAANDVLVDGSATAAFIRTIPYIFYGWAALIIVPLVATRILPTFGPMKKAEQRAESGELFPPGAWGKAVDEESTEATESDGQKANIMDFLLPVLVVVGLTMYTDDMLWGVMIGIVFALILYLSRKVITFSEFWDSFMSGFQYMIPALAIVVAAFILQQANEGVGLTPFVIETVQPIMTGALLPAVSFVVIAIIAFATGSFWGVAAISLPIIIPLAEVYGVNVFLASGAVISAAAFGSHACFYGDAATLTCASTQIPNIEYAKTTLPMLAYPLVLAIIAYLVAGYMAV